MREVGAVDPLFIYPVRDDIGCFIPSLSMKSEPMGLGDFHGSEPPKKPQADRQNQAQTLGPKAPINTKSGF